MRSRLIVFSLVFALSTVCAVVPAAAQDDFKGDVFLGYSWLGNSDLAINTSQLPWGWAAGGAYWLNDWLSIAVEVGGNYHFGLDPCGINTIALADPNCRTLEAVETPGPNVEFQGLSNHRTEEEFCSPNLDNRGVRAGFPNAEPSNPGCEVSINSTSLLAGPRVTIERFGVKFFGHVLPGIVRSTRSIDFFTHTAVNTAIMPGGGVEVDITDTVGFRFQADYRRVFFPKVGASNSSLVDRSDHDEFRFMLGFSFKVGPT